MTSPTRPMPKVYSLKLFETIHKSADTNNDGNVTRDELKSLKERLGQPGLPGLEGFTSRTGIRTTHEAIGILERNFRPIAYRALKEGEVTTMDVRPTDSTIELADLRKLASFDGINNNISIRDVGLLGGGNTENWPNYGYHPVPEPAPAPAPAPSPTPTNPLEDLFGKDFFKLILLLLLFGRR